MGEPQKYIDLVKPKSRACFFFFSPHVSRAKHLASTRTRTRVVQLGVQCTDHWTTEQSRGIGMPTVQLTMHDKSSNLYGHTSKFFQLDGLLLFCIIMGLCSVSSTIMANGEILVSPSQGIECNGINMVVRCQSSQRLRVIQA